MGIGLSDCMDVSPEAAFTKTINDFENLKNINMSVNDILLDFFEAVAPCEDKRFRAIQKWAEIFAPEN